MNYNINRQVHICIIKLHSLEKYEILTYLRKLTTLIQLLLHSVKMCSLEYIFYYLV